MPSLVPNVANLKKTTNLVVCTIHFVSFQSRLPCLSLNCHILEIVFISLVLDPLPLPPPPPPLRRYRDPGLNLPEGFQRL